MHLGKGGYYINYLITAKGERVPIQYAAVAFTGELYCEILSSDFADAVRVFSDSENVVNLSVEIDGEVVKIYENFTTLGYIALNAQNEHIVVGLRK